MVYQRGAACWVVVIILLFCLVSCPAAGVQEEVWELNVLQASHRIVPPSHSVTIRKDSSSAAPTVRISPLHRGPFHRMVLFLGRLLGVTGRYPDDMQSAAVKQNASLSEVPFCGLPVEHLTDHLEGVWENHLMMGSCGDPLVPVSLPLVTSFTRFPSPVPLAVEVNRDGKSSPGVCLPLSWRAESVNVMRVSPDHMVIEMHFSHQDDETAKCRLPIEANRWLGEPSNSWSLVLTVVSLAAVVWVLRSGILSSKMAALAKSQSPMYRASSSTGGAKKRQLTPAERQALLKRQHEIIQQMKKQDKVD